MNLVSLVKLCTAHIFEPEPELANHLATKSKLNAGICTWYLQRKLRKGRTEQEVMDHSKAKKVKET